MWRCTTHGWKHTYGDNFMKPVLSFHLNMVWRPKPDLSNKHDGPMSHITHSWNLNFSEFHHWFYGFCHQCMFIALFLLSTLAHWWTCVSSAGHCLNDGAILVNLCQLLLVFQTFVLWLCWPFNVLLDIHVNFRVIFVAIQKFFWRFDWNCTYISTWGKLLSSLDWVFLYMHFMCLSNSLMFFH